MDATAATDDISVAEVWAEIERVVSRGQVAAALEVVLELAPPPDEEADDGWRAELAKRYQTIRPFLPVLTEVIEFGSVEGGQLVVEAVCHLGRKKGRDRCGPGDGRLVYMDANAEQGVVDHRAYSSSGRDRFVPREEQPEGGSPHCGFLLVRRFQDPPLVHAAQQISLPTSRENVRAASFKPSAKVG